MSTQVTTRASKRRPRAAAKPPEPAEEEEVADGLRKGRARRRRKATAAPALSEPEALVKAKRSRRTSARRGRGEAGSPCGFQTHRRGLRARSFVSRGARGCQKAGEEPAGLCGAEPGTPSPSDFSFPSPSSRRSPCRVSAARCPPPEGHFNSRRSSSGRAWPGAWVSAGEKRGCSVPVLTPACYRCVLPVWEGEAGFGDGADLSSVLLLSPGI